MPNGRAPRIGELFCNPDLAASLRLIGSTGGETFYRDELAENLVQHSSLHGGLMMKDDLAEYQPNWYGTLNQKFGGVSLHEIPPNSQGLATLIALGFWVFLI